MVSHYSDVTMGTIASQITSISIVYLTVSTGADQRKHQSPASLAFVRGIHRGPVNSPHKMPSNAKNVSIWWRHHECSRKTFMVFQTFVWWALYKIERICLKIPLGIDICQYGFADQTLFKMTDEILRDITRYREISSITKTVRSPNKTYHLLIIS